MLPSSGTPPQALASAGPRARQDRCDPRSVQVSIVSVRLGGSDFPQRFGPRCLCQRTASRSRFRERVNLQWRCAGPERRRAATVRDAPPKFSSACWPRTRQEGNQFGRELEWILVGPPAGTLCPGLSLLDGGPRGYLEPTPQPALPLWAQSVRPTRRRVRRASAPPPRCPRALQRRTIDLDTRSHGAFPVRASDPTGRSGRTPASRFPPGRRA